MFWKRPTEGPLTQARVLVTHGIGFLPQCDKIVVMVDGKITETGSYTELIENNGAFAEFLRNYSNVENEGEEEEEDGECVHNTWTAKSIFC